MENTSDVLLNNWAGDFRLGMYDDKQLVYNPFAATILPFTHNCGIKAIQDLYFIDNFLTKKEAKSFRKLTLHYLESFLFHVCTAGMVVGSDGAHGSTTQILEKAGDGYIFSEKVQNPTYTILGVKNHKVHFFHKNLFARKGEYDPALWETLIQSLEN